MDAHVKQLLLLGREHFQRGEYDKADYLLKQVVTSGDRFADVLDMLGVIAHLRGDYSQAELYFRRALELNPAYTEAQLNLLVTYTELGKYEAASELSSKLKGDAGRTLASAKIANLHAATAQAYEDAGRPADAILELEKAVTLGPTFSDLRVRLARLLRETGDPKRAASELAKALENSPRYVTAHLELAMLHLSEGRRGAALEALEPVRRIDPDNRRARVYRRAFERAVSTH
jgi:tetratricopeptide (TPR) repeat protein